MSSRASNVKVSILGDASDLKHATDEASAHVKEFSEKTKESFAKVKEAGKLLAEVGGLSALTFGLKDVTEEAVKAEAEQKKLANTVKDAGLSWRAHGKEIDEWLDKTSRASGFAKSDLSASLGNLIRTTGSVTESQKLSGLAMDVARSKGVGLASAQSLLARVYNGSYTGLKRLGVSITPVTAAQDQLKASTGKATDAQKEHAKALDAAATRTKALQTIQEKFGGQSAAYAKSTAGSFERAKQSLNLFEEQIGNLVLPLMAKAANAISGVADAADKEWPKIAPVVKQTFASVKTDVLAVVTVVKGLVTGFQQGKTSATAIAGALGGLAVAAVIAKAFDVAKNAVTGLSTAFKVLRVALLSNPFTAIALALAVLGAALVTAYKHNEEFRAKVQAAWAWIRAQAGPIFIAVKNAVVVAFQAIKTAVSTAIQFVQGWIDKNRANIVQFGQAWLNIGKFIATVVKTYITNLLIPELKVLWTAIQAGWTLVKAAWPGILQVIQSAIKVISGIIAVFTGVFTGDWQKAWGGLKAIASGALGGVEGVLKAAVGVLGKAAGAIGDAMKSALAAAFNGVVDVIKGALNGVIDIYNDAINAINAATPGAIKVAGHTVVPGIPDIPQIPHFAAGGVVVPGATNRDGTLVMAAGGETVFTRSGQAIINTVGAMAGVKNLVGAALTNQLPHFGGGGTIGYQGLESLWVRNGGNPGAEQMAAAIAMAESGGNQYAQDNDSDGSIDRGYWQINSVHGALSTFDANANARAAVSISNNGRNWSPWVTYQTGAYKRFLQGGSVASPGGVSVSIGSGSGSGSGGGGTTSKPKAPAVRFPGASGAASAGAAINVANLPFSASQSARTYQGGIQAAEFAQAQATTPAALLKAVMTEIALKTKRLATIKKALKRRLTTATRSRLIEEAKTLIGDLATLWDVAQANGAKGGPPAGVIPNSSLASSNGSAGGDTGSGPPTIWDQLSAEGAAAQLTPGTDDDIAVAQKVVNARQADFNSALATGDPRVWGPAAQALADAISALNALQGSVDQSNAIAQQQLDLTQQLVDNQDKILAVANTQAAMWPALISAIVNGDIGGKVGLGSQSPAFAGQLGRY